MTEYDSEVEVPVDESPENSQFASKPDEVVDKTQPQGNPTETEQQPNESVREQSEEQFDPQKEGIEEGKAEKAEVPGDTEREKTERALQSKLQSVENFEGEIRQAKQQIVQLQQHKQDIEETVERVENASDDQRVMEHLDSQMASVEVPADEREDFLERLNSKVEETEQEISQTQERGGALQRGLQKNRIAVQWLQTHYENLS